MPVHREKESVIKHDKKITSTRESSTTRKVKRDESQDRRPLITQDKPSKSRNDRSLQKQPSTSTTNNKRRVETKKEKSVDRKAPEKPEKPEKPGKSTEDKARSKIDSRRSKDVITMKDVLDKRMTSRMTESVDDSIRKKEVVQKERTKHGDTQKNDKERSKHVRDHEKEGKERSKNRELQRETEKRSKNRELQREAKERSKHRDTPKEDKSRRDRTRTRTLSPTEVKQLKKSYLETGAGDRNLEFESRINAIRKKIVDEKGDLKSRTAGFEAKAEAEENDKEEEGEEEEDENEADYEDDFENYESDFEDDSEGNEESDREGQTAEEEEKEEEEQELQTVPPTNEESILKAETEKKMDSGSYDMKAHVQKKEIEDVRRAIEKENFEVVERRKSSAGIRYDAEKENLKKKRNEFHMYNFSTARKRQQEQKVAAKAKKRGEELLSMIALDAISYTLMEIPSIPYEVYMKIHGRSNTQQVHVQTNEDDLDEETQTDSIVTSNKWTQNPPEFTLIRTGGDVQLPSKEERIGVGDDSAPSETVQSYTNTNRLSEFLSSAGQLILTTLESASGSHLNPNKMPRPDSVPFSDGCTSMNTQDVHFLNGRSVSTLHFSNKTNSYMLSVHPISEDSNGDYQRCMICVWSVEEPSKPFKILTVSNHVTCCCFGPQQGNLVFAGLTDGSVCLWDLRESFSRHEATVDSQTGWSLRSPTYSTAEILKNDGHRSSVVSVQLLSRSDENNSRLDFTPTQICSMEESGIVIVWTVIQNRSTSRNIPNDDLGLAHWGKVKLVKSSSFSVFSDLRDDSLLLYATCTDLAINEEDENGLYITNSLGKVYHCSIYGSLMKPKYYGIKKQDAIIETTCLEMCPFDSNYFLVGCGDGSIRIHSRHQENPLICLNGNVVEHGEAAIISLVWLYMRPCVFLALDSLSRIHIWDLGVSDMYPEVTVNLTDKKITCMKVKVNHKQTPCVVLGTATGSIEIHRLKKEYGTRTPEERQKEMKMFLRYVSIL